MAMALRPDRDIEVNTAVPAPVKLNIVYTNQTSRVDSMIDLFDKILRKHKETKAIEKTSSTPCQK